VRMQIAILTAVIATCGLMTVALAEEPDRHARLPAGIQAGLDAFELGEAQRRGRLAQQLALTDELRYWAGWPVGVNALMPYGYAGPWLPANLDYAYAFGGARPAMRPSPRGWVAPLTVFEPWPFVPGDIYGLPYLPPPPLPAARELSPPPEAPSPPPTAPAKRRPREY
jgi:hypothetical protein